MFFVIVSAVVTIFIQQFYSVDFFLNKNNEYAFQMTNLYGYGQERLQSIYSWISVLGIGFAFLPMVGLIMEKLLIEKKNVLFWIFVTICFISVFFDSFSWMYA